MIGTYLNVAGILIGGIVGLASTKQLSLVNQSAFKVALGAATVLTGLFLTWNNINGSIVQILQQLGIVILSLVLGRIVGRILHLQKGSNRLGQFARERMARVRPAGPQRFNDGFAVCAVLFCAAPLGILGAIHDGLSQYFAPLIVKAVIDGLAAMSFAAMFGWGILFSAIPVLVFQGTITLLCARFIQPLLATHELVQSVNATGGLLIFSVALLIFETKKVEVTDYLPSLAFAPLLTFWWLR